jgi:hypothetical protein
LRDWNFARLEFCGTRSALPRIRYARANGLLAAVLKQLIDAAKKRLGLGPRIRGARWVEGDECAAAMLTDDAFAEVIDPHVQAPTTGRTLLHEVS